MENGENVVLCKPGEFCTSQDVLCYAAVTDDLPSLSAFTTDIYSVTVSGQLLPSAKTQADGAAVPATTPVSQQR